MLRSLSILSFQCSENSIAEQEGEEEEKMMALMQMMIER